MTSKQEIRSLFITELRNTLEYQKILDVKQAIIAEIARPCVKRRFVYMLSNDFDYEVLKLCAKVELDVDIFINDNTIEVFMDKFLQE
jgi:hypothetical protein